MPPRTRKIAAVSDTPKIGLNLDTLEREGGVAEPFSAIIDGKRYVFGDAAEIDWKQILTSMRNPAAFFNNVLAEKDRKTFLETDIPTWKINALMSAYTEHYGMTNSPEAGALPGF